MFVSIVKAIGDLYIFIIIRNFFVQNKLIQNNNKSLLAILIVNNRINNFAIESIPGIIQFTTLFNYDRVVFFSTVAFFFSIGKL